MSETSVTLTIDGQKVEASADSSIIQAYAHAGGALTANVGCMGQGVCGSCRCMIREEGSSEVRTALACETKVAQGMQVGFIDYFIPEHVHYYDLNEIGDGWNWLEDTERAFPEAAHCRHCGGCNRACPKELEVENGVAQVVAGDFSSAAATFDQCVMCNLCTLACPENIRPNHLGLYARRMKAARTLRPVDLMRRLQEIDSGRMTVNLNGSEA
ncbi:4Fe-4S dicluster domain-containing protein [Neisseria sp.]|uniref:4Fe-4S dicluster domain-containing protein n=1 Tax=Neisseria sp. TaxID=192066 RepID=UPI0035A0CD74